MISGHARLATSEAMKSSVFTRKADCEAADDLARGGLGAEGFFGFRDLLYQSVQPSRGDPVPARAVSCR